MQITTCITPDDYRDFLALPRISGRRARRARIANLELVFGSILLLIVVGIFFSSLGLLVLHVPPAELLHRPRSVLLALSGLLLTPLAVIWLKSSYRLRRKIRSEVKDPMDQRALKDGVTVGEARFDVDDDGFQCSLALVHDSYAWEAFQRVEETETCFYLMIDTGEAEIVPKRAFADLSSLQAFKAFVQSRISGSG